MGLSLNGLGSCLRTGQWVSLLAIMACGGGNEDTTAIDDPAPRDPASGLDSANSGDTAEPTTREYGEVFSEAYEPRTYEAMVDEVQQAFTAPLTAGEEATIDDILSRAEGDFSMFRSAGRVLTDDDTFFRVDPILGTGVADVEKGRTLAPGATPVSMQTGAQTPDYARMDPSNPADFQWKRPYFGLSGLKIIVPSAAVRDIVQLAVDQVANASGSDCIGSSSIDVILPSEWNALGQQQAYHATISVAYGTQAAVCPYMDQTKTWAGCANFPQTRSIWISGSGISQVRMVAGQYIGLNNSFVTGTDAQSVSIVLHELLHTLGFAHTWDDGAGPHFDIPGTSGKSAATSVMRPVGGGSTSTSLSTDDQRSIAVLYTTQPGSTCSPVVYETTCSQACVAVSASNVAGQCCWCNGTKKYYVKSAWSGTTYICQ